MKLLELFENTAPNWTKPSTCAAYVSHLSLSSVLTVVPSIQSSIKVRRLHQILESRKQQQAEMAALKSTMEETQPHAMTAPSPEEVEGLLQTYRERQNEEDFAHDTEYLRQDMQSVLQAG